MIERINRLVVAGLIIVLAMTAIGRVYAVETSTRELLTSSTGPVVRSVWTGSAPVIDGKFVAGEYDDPQIVFNVPPYNNSYLNTSVHFVNDAKWLYVLVDATGDQTDNPLDEALLVFGYSPNAIGSTIVAFRGVAGFECTYLGVNAAPSHDCVVPRNTHVKIGYDVSPNSIYSHKIFEAIIPLDTIGKSGQAINFSSPKANVFPLCMGKGCQGGSLGYDSETGKDNVWPQGLVLSSVETWGILILASGPIPEFPHSTAFVVAATLACLMLLTKRLKQSCHRSS